MDFFQSLSEEQKTWMLRLALAIILALGIFIINIHARLHRRTDERLGKCETDIAREQGRHD